MCDKLDIVTTKCSIDNEPCGFRQAEIISVTGKFDGFSYHEYRDSFYKCTKPGKVSKGVKPTEVPESF